MDDWYQRVVVARPFLRWVGGKQAFLARLGSLLPSVAGTYYEPFLGSGAVFFHLQRAQGRPLEAVLGDSNLQLIQTFDAVRTDPEQVYAALTALQNEYSEATDKAEFFYKIREAYNEELPAADPAKFIFLNRTCWNGLYRVNQLGLFNVPYGRPKRDRVIPELEELKNAGAALIRAKLRASSWENTIAKAKPGDFVFLDPPYYSDIERDDRKYRARNFTLANHERLAERLRSFAERGIDFILTNSAEPVMLDLYASHDLSVSVVDMPRSISTKVKERVPAPELVVTPVDNSERTQQREEILIPYLSRHDHNSTTGAIASLQSVVAEG